MQGRAAAGAGSYKGQVADRFNDARRRPPARGHDDFNVPRTGETDVHLKAVTHAGPEFGQLNQFEAVAFRPSVA